MFRKNRIRNSNGNPPGQSLNAFESLWFVIPLASSLLLARFLFDAPREPGHNELMVLLYAATTILAAVLLTPLNSSFSLQSLWVLGSHCAITTTIFLATTLIDPQTRGLLPELLLSAGLLFLMLLASLSLLLIFVVYRTNARQIVFFSITALLLAPLWLGPLAEISGNTPVPSNLIVGINPLSAIATTLDFDYLRTSWLYKHSVLGSLRYEYFSGSSYALVLITIIAGCSLGAADVKFTRLAQPFKKRVTAS